MIEVSISQLIVLALAISQILINPKEIRSQFTPGKDEPVVLQLLQTGCPAALDELTKELNIKIKPEDTGFDEALTLFIESAVAKGESLNVKGLDLKSVHAAYKMFCTKSSTNAPASAAGEALPVINLTEVIETYNSTLKDLPNPNSLKGLKLPQSAQILDVFGTRFTEVYKADNRRKWLSLNQIPTHVKLAFVAAEDARFFEHRGVDLRGILRAFSSISESKKQRPQGGSTITQQLVKNLLVGDEVTPTRKIREVIVAAQLEQVLSKDEILELYLNYVFLGRASWGIEMAAQSYFGKSATQLNFLEGALLAGLTKGPNFYNPEIFMDRAQARTAYVLKQMRDYYRGRNINGFADGDYERALTEKQAFKLVAFEAPRKRASFFLVDHIVKKAANELKLGAITENAYVVKSTIHPKLQPIAEHALQEGLAQFEIGANRVKSNPVEKNIQSKIDQFAEENPDQDPQTAWHKVLMQTRAPLYDVQWPLAVVVPGEKNRKVVGLKDGRILPLQAWNKSPLNRLRAGDLVHVEIKGEVAHLRFRPQVQGSVIVMENKSGRILAMSGGFSYVLSQYNRAIAMKRQPGSTVKPLTYLAALQAGVSPNRVLVDAGLTLPPIVRGPGEKFWSIGHRATGRSLTVRQGLEQSNNQITARLLFEFGRNPAAALDATIDLCVEMKLCQDSRPGRYYPFILGSQEVRLIDLVNFYATIANEGLQVSPFVVESIALDDKEVFSMKGDNYRRGVSQVRSTHPEVFRTMKAFLQGVLVRGTAKSIRDLAPYVAGKTGTTNSSKDVWFVGFSNDITIGVWVGYDDQRKALGATSTGARVALPIFKEIIQQSFSPYVYKAPTPLNVPTPNLQLSSLDEQQPLPNGENPDFANWWPEQQPQQIPGSAFGGGYSPPPEDMDEIRAQRRQQRQQSPRWSPFRFDGGG